MACPGMVTLSGVRGCGPYSKSVFDEGEGMSLRIGTGLMSGECAVELPRREVGSTIGENDCAKAVRQNAQLAPAHEICRALDGVNSRRSGDGELKRSQRLS